MLSVFIYLFVLGLSAESPDTDWTLISELIEETPRAQRLRATVDLYFYQQSTGADDRSSRVVKYVNALRNVEIRTEREYLIWRALQLLVKKEDRTFLFIKGKGSRLLRASNRVLSRSARLNSDLRGWLIRDNLRADIENNLSAFPKADPEFLEYLSAYFSQPIQEKKSKRNEDYEKKRGGLGDKIGDAILKLTVPEAALLNGLVDSVSEIFEFPSIMFKRYIEEIKLLEGEELLRHLKIALEMLALFNVKDPKESISEFLPTLDLDFDETFISSVLSLIEKDLEDEVNTRTLIALEVLAKIPSAHPKFLPALQTAIQEIPRKHSVRKSLLTQLNRLQVEAGLDAVDDSRFSIAGCREAVGRIISGSKSF